MKRIANAADTITFPPGIYVESNVQIAPTTKVEGKSKFAVATALGTQKDDV